MFTIFKSNRARKIVEQIHAEIDSAEDRLLQQAKTIISGANVHDGKAARLKAVGFEASAVVKRHEEKARILVTNTEQANLIEYYKQNYPFQKFITEEELNRICQKYSLVFAPIARYTGDVPEKNLRDIEQMPKLKDSDSAGQFIYCKIRYHGADIVGISTVRARIMGLPKVINGQHFRHWSEADAYMREQYNLTSQYICESIDNVTEDRTGLFIAAPAKEFDLKGLVKKSKFGFLSITVTTIKDPIVFRYVRGGIQIITKWGLEASDELVVNEKQN